MKTEFKAGSCRDCGASHWMERERDFVCTNCGLNVQKTGDSNGNASHIRSIYNPIHGNSRIADLARDQSKEVR